MEKLLNPNTEQQGNRLTLPYSLSFIDDVFPGTIITIPSKATTAKSHKFPEKRHNEQKTHLDEFKCSLTVFRVSRVFLQLDLQKCLYKIQGSLKPFNSQDVIVDSPLYSCYTFPNKSITKCLMLDQDNKFYLISLSNLIFCLLDALLIL